MSFVMNTGDENTIKYWEGKLESHPSKKRFLRTKMLEIKTFKAASLLLSGKSSPNGFDNFASGKSSSKISPSLDKAASVESSSFSKFLGKAASIKEVQHGTVLNSSASIKAVSVEATPIKASLSSHKAAPIESVTEGEVASAHFAPTKKENFIKKDAKVAVIIPAFIKNKSALKMLFNLIDCLKKQTVKPSLVIVINDCSSVAFEIKAAFVKQIDLKENKGPANARNVGLDLALGSGCDIIAFTDSDTRPDIFWVESIIKGFIANKNAQVLSGQTVSFGFTALDEYHTINGTLNGRRFFDSELLLYGPTCNLAIDSFALKDGTRFSCDFPLAASEDIYFCYELLRKGNNIFFAPNMKIAHDFGYKKWTPFSNKRAFKKLFEKYAKGEEVLLKKIPNYYSYLEKTKEISPVCDKVVTLVTGGAGFIGSHLCRKLLKLGRRVICFDNLSTGTFDNIADMIENKDFKFIKGDVTLPYNIYATEIYNLACPASPAQYQKDPVKTLLTNVLGAKNALDNALRYKAKILQASTSEVYGDPKTSVQKESYWGNVNSIGVRSCYDEGKRAAETLFFDYWRAYKVMIKVVRIFNTYGPAVMRDDGRVISNFIAQAKSGEDLTVYGDGSQTRSFCYIDDTVRALILMMATSFETTGPVNIGRDEEVSILELAKLIIKITGSRSKIKYLPLPKDDPKSRRPDTSLIKALLGWEGTISLKAGVSKILNCDL